MPAATFDQAPLVAPPLDSSFRPFYLALREHARALGEGGEKLTLALDRGAGSVSHYTLRVFTPSHERAAESAQLAERVLKFLLWQRGGHHVYVAGPRYVAEHLAARYREGGERAFDADFFAKIYEQPAFVIEPVEEAALPAEAELGKSVGGHLNGCRIGFDAGGSDRKVAAVIDGKEVFSSETVWHPKLASDPNYHFDGIDDSIRQAAAHLPRIDAIGVSSAGIYVDNRTMIASLFRKVPEAQFHARIKSIYQDIAKKWGDVPLEVANDGDVTALAGALELKDDSVLGIAMGTSQAAGYVNQHGLITGWVNELAFAPVDVSADAPVDTEWSGDKGTGVSYFSQDAAIRLAKRAGVELPADASPGEKLKQLQKLMLEGDTRASAIFESLGVYLGYGLLLYAEFYALKHVLLLGRVTSGEGGELLLNKAREVLRRENPGLAARLAIHLPDEATRRVGQSIAAASLPRI
ncbi:MAG: transcriptional regulator [Polyangiaceae bacterium]|nr:transcriptional regulator [Polyangiaceae bacterium]